MKRSVQNQSCNRCRNPQRGSALLVTVLMMSVLLLAVLAFTTQVRLETRVLRDTQHQRMAERNAVLALDLAIAALQAQAGPDQRVTARADLAIPSGVSLVPDSFNLTTGDLTAAGTSGADAAAAVNAHWAAAAANRHWVGVYRNSNSSSYDPARPVDFNAIPELLAWLVSGNELSPSAFSPGDRIDGLSHSATP